MRRLAFLVPALVLLGGCGGDRLYYQTRYIPTSSEQVYSITEQATWSGDHEVYELPAPPPDLNGEHRPRVNCAAPGPKFKVTAQVGLSDEADHSYFTPDHIPAGAYDERIQLTGPTTAMHGPRTAAYDNDPYAPGLPAKVDNGPVGCYDGRPQSITGAGTNTIPSNTANCTFHDQGNPYCFDHLQPGVKPPVAQAVQDQKTLDQQTKK
jgi:hypothetical protein